MERASRVVTANVTANEGSTVMSTAKEPTSSDPSESARREQEREASRPPGAHGKEGEDSDGRSEPYEEEPESPTPTR